MRNPDEQGIQDSLSKVGLKDLDGDHRSGMRWHESMHDRKSRDQRNADLQEWHARPLGHDERERNQQHQSDLEENRDADDAGDDHHCPVYL